jgi:hypothetical protein
MAAFAIAAMSYMYALFVNMYDNLYYMLVQEIKAFAHRVAQPFNVRGRLRDILPFGEEGPTGGVSAAYSNGG